MEMLSFPQTNLGNVQETADQNSQELPFIRPNNGLTNALCEKTPSIKKEMKSDDDTKISDDSCYKDNSEKNLQPNKPSISKLVEPNIRAEHKSIEIDIQTSSAVTDLQDQTKSQSSNNLVLKSIQENTKPFEVVSNQNQYKENPVELVPEHRKENKTSDDMVSGYKQDNKNYVDTASKNKKWNKYYVNVGVEARKWKFGVGISTKM